MAETTRPRTIRMPDDAYRRAEAVARDESVPVASVLRRWIEDGAAKVDGLELHREQIAETVRRLEALSAQDPANVRLTVHFGASPGELALFIDKSPVPPDVAEPFGFLTTAGKTLQMVLSVRAPGGATAFVARVPTGVYGEITVPPAALTANTFFSADDA
jgi:predicted DNA-binding protein